MPWNKEFECMPVEKLQKFQLEKLQETVAWVAKKVPFYKKKFKELGIKEADFPEIAKKSFANNSNPSNPREVTTQDYVGILSKANSDT